MLSASKGPSPRLLRPHRPPPPSSSSPSLAVVVDEEIVEQPPLAVTRPPPSFLPASAPSPPLSPSPSLSSSSSSSSLSSSSSFPSLTSPPPVWESSSAASAVSLPVSGGVGGGAGLRSASTSAASPASAEGSDEEESDDEGGRGRERAALLRHGSSQQPHHSPTLRTTTLTNAGQHSYPHNHSPSHPTHTQPPSAAATLSTAAFSSAASSTTSSLLRFPVLRWLWPWRWRRSVGGASPAPPSASPSLSSSPSRLRGFSSSSKLASAPSSSASSHPPRLLLRSVSSSRASALHLVDARRLPLHRLLALSAYWFGWSFLWLPLLVVLIPVQAEQLAGDASKGAALGSILILGSVVSVATAPLVGSYSDSSTHPIGRRRPFMVVGTCLASVALIALAAAPSVELLSLAFAALSLANNLIIAPYSALVPDLVPLEQRGVASGCLGLFSMLGNVCGGAVGSLQSTIGLPAIYLILLIVHALSMAATCRWTQEEPLDLASPHSPHSHSRASSVSSSSSPSSSTSPPPSPPSASASSPSVHHHHDHHHYAPVSVVPVSSSTSTSTSTSNSTSSSAAPSALYLLPLPLPLVRSPPTGCRRLYSLVSPFLSHDFRVVFFTRFVMQLGVLTVQEYLLFYLDDEIGQESPLYPGEKVFIAYGRVLARSKDQATTLLFAPTLLAAIVSSIASGLLSDAMGGRRKRLLYASGGVMACAGVLFALTRSFAVDLVLGGLFGLGFGAFSVLDWALAADVLPHQEQIAKDLGLWSLSLVVPQVLAAPLAGSVLDFFRAEGLQSLGYTIVFLLAAAFFLLGTACVKALEGVD